MRVDFVPPAAREAPERVDNEPREREFDAALADAVDQRSQAERAAEAARRADADRRLETDRRSARVREQEQAAAEQAQREATTVQPRAARPPAQPPAPNAAQEAPAPTDEVAPDEQTEADRARSDLAMLSQVAASIAQIVAPPSEAGPTSDAANQAAALQSAVRTPTGAQAAGQPLPTGFEASPEETQAFAAALAAAEGSALPAPAGPQVPAPSAVPAQPQAAEAAQPAQSQAVPPGAQGGLGFAQASLQPAQGLPANAQASAPATEGNQTVPRPGAATLPNAGAAQIAPAATPQPATSPFVAPPGANQPQPIGANAAAIAQDAAQAAAAAGPTGTLTPATQAQIAAARAAQQQASAPAVPQLATPPAAPSANLATPNEAVVVNAAPSAAQTPQNVAAANANAVRPPVVQTEQPTPSAAPTTTDGAQTAGPAQQQTAAQAQAQAGAQRENVAANQAPARDVRERMRAAGQPPSPSEPALLEANSAPPPPAPPPPVETSPAETPVQTDAPNRRGAPSANLGEQPSEQVQRRNEPQYPAPGGFEPWAQLVGGGGGQPTEGGLPQHVKPRTHHGAEPIGRIEAFARGARAGSALSAYSGRGHEGADHDTGMMRGKRGTGSERPVGEEHAAGIESYLNAAKQAAVQHQANPQVPMPRDAAAPELARPPVPVAPPPIELPEMQVMSTANGQPEKASISLHHPDLGPIQLQVQREAGRVEVHALIDSAHAAAVLRANESGIRQGVQQSGMALSGLKVRIREEEAPPSAEGRSGTAKKAQRRTQQQRGT